MVFIICLRSIISRASRRHYLMVPRSSSSQNETSRTHHHRRRSKMQNRYRRVFEARVDGFRRSRRQLCCSFKLLLGVPPPRLGSSSVLGAKFSPTRRHRRATSLSSTSSSCETSRKCL